MKTKQMKKGVELRRHARRPLGLAVKAKGLSGSIINISEGGMAFQSAAELEPGASLCLKAQPLELRGEVRHVSRTGDVRLYGVRFHKINLN